MRSFFTKIRLSVLLLILLPACAGAQQLFFTNVQEAAIAKAGLKRVIVPAVFRTLQLDISALMQFLRTLPSERTITNRNTTPVIYLPPGQLYYI